MQAGLLNEIIIWESPETFRNEYGEERIQWIHRATTKAAVKWQGGNRTVENQAVTFNNYLQFTVRAYHDIKQTDRIIWKGQHYRIISPPEDRKAEQCKVINVELINE